MIKASRADPNPRVGPLFLRHRRGPVDLCQHVKGPAPRTNRRSGTPAPGAFLFSRRYATARRQTPFPLAEEGRCEGDREYVRLLCIIRGGKPRRSRAVATETSYAYREHARSQVQPVQADRRGTRGSRVRRKSSPGLEPRLSDCCRSSVIPRRSIQAVSRAESTWHRTLMLLARRSSEPLKGRIRERTAPRNHIPPRKEPK